jgi:hypothetical protein
MVIAIALAGPAEASFHKWVINEIYSNFDGTVQFIELYSTEDLQDELGSEFLLSDLATFQFEFDLPDSATGFRYVLIGTQSYSQAPGAVAPDYVIEDNFFTIDGDTIIFANVDLVAFGPGDLPIDGDLSIDRDLLSAPNSPINFSFEEGHLLLPEPNRDLLMSAGLVTLALLGRCRLLRARMPAGGGNAPICQPKGRSPSMTQRRTSPGTGHLRLDRHRFVISTPTGGCKRS